MQKQTLKAKHVIQQSNILVTDGWMGWMDEDSTSDFIYSVVAVVQGTNENPGVNPRALDELFDVAAERSQDWDYTITMSVLEIYNEQVRDLLGENPSAKMDVRQQTDGRLYVPGLNWVQVKSRDDVQEVHNLKIYVSLPPCVSLWTRSI